MQTEYFGTEGEARERAAGCISLGRIVDLLRLYFGEGYASVVRRSDQFEIVFTTGAGFPVDPTRPDSSECASFCEICKEEVSYSGTEAMWYFKPAFARVSFSALRPTKFVWLRADADVNGFLEGYLPLPDQSKKNTADESGAAWRAKGVAIRKELEVACRKALYAAFADMEKIPAAHRTLRVADLRSVVRALADDSNRIWQCNEASALVSVLDRVVSAMAR